MIRLPPSAFYALAFGLSFVLVLLTTPLAAKIAVRLDLLDRPKESKFHTSEIPYLGGAALAVGLVAVAGVTAGASGQLLVIILGALSLLVVGLMDDQRLVSPRFKLVVESAAGIALWLAGVRAGLFGVEALDLLLTVVWTVGVTNAVNMLDNMDGLAAGTAAISAVAFFAIAAGEGDYLVGALALAVAGACLGFLRYNFPPARVFLGDAGTLLLGFLLAALGLKLDLVGENGLIRSAVPILALAVPMFDATLVIVARLREGRPIYIGGVDHSSHRLAGLGLSGRAIAILTYLAQAAAAAIAVWLLEANWPVALGIVLTAGVLGAVGLLVLLSIPQRPRRPSDVELSPAKAPPPR